MYPDLPSPKTHINQAAIDAYPRLADETGTTINQGASAGSLDNEDGDDDKSDKVSAENTNKCCNKCLRCGVVIASSRLAADALILFTLFQMTRSVVRKVISVLPA